MNTNLLHKDIEGFVIIIVLHVIYKKVFLYFI